MDHNIIQGFGKLEIDDGPMYMDDDSEQNNNSNDENENDLALDSDKFMNLPNFNQIIEKNKEKEAMSKERLTEELRITDFEKRLDERKNAPMIYKKN